MPTSSPDFAKYTMSEAKIRFGAQWVEDAEPVHAIAEIEINHNDSVELDMRPIDSRMPPSSFS